MKIDRLIWGILFLFVGSVVLLDNFDVINFYWRNIWQFWPVILIIIGVNVLLGRKESNIGGIVSVSILILTLGYLFYRGQQPPEYSRWYTEGFNGNWSLDDDDDAKNLGQRQVFAEPYTNQTLTNATINLFCGGTSLKLNETSDSLFTASVVQQFGRFNYEKQLSDTSAEINLRMSSNKIKGTRGKGSNKIELKLHPNPIWAINMQVGAGSMDIDLTPFKVSSLNFEGGAASVELKLGDKNPVTNVHVKTGVAEIKINVPTGSGCRIITKTGLSSTNFEGFSKKEDGSYETPNFASSAKKIYINFDGGLSSFEVNRY